MLAMVTNDRVALKTVVAASPDDLFDAWTNPARHAQFTGAEATGAARVGEAYTAWDGYIEGRYLEIEPPRRVRMTWRTSDFADTDPDSLLELTLAPAAHGTTLTLVHEELPPGEGARYEQGWQEFYFEPLARFFAATPRPKRAPVAKKTAAKKTAAKKTAAKKTAAKKTAAKKR